MGSLARASEAVPPTKLKHLLNKSHADRRLEYKNGSQQLLQLFPAKGAEPEAGALGTCPKTPTVQQSLHPAIHVEDRGEQS